MHGDPASPERAEGSSQLVAEDFRLLPCRAAAPRAARVEVDAVRETRLGPAARPRPVPAGERGEPYRDVGRGREWTAGGWGVGPVGLPVRPSRGRADAAQPVQRDVV